MLRVKTVLFDLDETLFDHQYASQSGLATLQTQHECLQAKPLEVLEREFFGLIEVVHEQVLQGAMSFEAARVERFRQLFLHCGEPISQLEAEAIAARYRAIYRAARRPVPGVLPLLERLAPIVKVGVVTNSFVAEQSDKIRCCGLEPFVGFLVTAEEVQEPKPARAIFEAALTRAGCRASEAVMVGDSWQADVLGAHGAGIRAIWLNRHGLACPDPTLAQEIRSFGPLESVLDLLLGQQDVLPRSNRSEQ